MGTKGEKQKPKEAESKTPSMQQVGGDKRGDRIEAVPAIVEEIVGRTGTRGEITQVKAHIMQGPDRGKSIRRNVRGPIRLKDVLMLRETAIEARRIRTAVMKGAFT